MPSPTASPTKIDERFQAEHDVAARMELLHALGLAEDRPIAALDDLARRLAHDFSDRTAREDGFHGFVNIIKDGYQFFAGLYIPTSPDVGDRPIDGAIPEEARIMPLSEGWCVHVLVRRLALPLRHVLDMPRGSSNPAIAKLGAATYLGAPLIHPDGGIPFGTAALVGRARVEWTREHVAVVKGYAAEALDVIVQLLGRTGTASR